MSRLRRKLPENGKRSALTVLDFMGIFPKALGLAAIAIALTACGEAAQLPIFAGIGTHPQLLSPNPTLIPTVNIAQAVGWPANGKPSAAPGLTVNAFAAGLDHPRWLVVLPNGDVLVAETNAPAKPEDGQGIKGWIMRSGRILPHWGWCFQKTPDGLRHLITGFLLVSTARGIASHAVVIR